ncbi:MAG: PocR ligand-binding domain-containing protein [Desulfobacter sp.]
MELTDICPLSRWEALENDIYDKFNFQGSVFNPHGIRITQVKNWSNTLCPAIKATEKGQSYICSVAHMNMTAIAKNTRAAVVEECDAGFSKIVVPIFYRDAFLGVAGGCGLIAEDGEADAFAVAKIAGLDESRVAELSRDLPLASREQIAAAETFVRDQVSQIISNHDQ